MPTSHLEWLGLYIILEVFLFFFLYLLKNCHIPCFWFSFDSNALTTDFSLGLFRLSIRCLSYPRLFQIACLTVSFRIVFSSKCMPGAFGVGLYLSLSCLCRFLFLLLWFWRLVGAFVACYMALLMYLFTFSSIYISFILKYQTISRNWILKWFFVSYCCIVGK